MYRGPVFDLPEGEDPTSFTLLVAQNGEAQEIPLTGAALTAPAGSPTEATE